MRRFMKKLNLMSPVKLTGVITLLACLFFLAGAAGATVLYDNLNNTDTIPTTRFRTLGRSFITRSPQGRAASV